MAAIACKFFFATQIPSVCRIPGHSWWGTSLTQTSLGPWGYLLLRDDQTAVAVDMPYYSDKLAEQVKECATGGITHFLFTHDDFLQMSGHDSWHAVFPEAIRVAHADDAGRSSLELKLTGNGPWEVAGFQVHRVPGHSPGSLFYTSTELSATFSGDSIGFWDGRPNSFASYCRFGLDRQAASLRSYAENVAFCAMLFPGHGQPMVFANYEDRLKKFFAAAEDLTRGQ
eukprot:TRINITY_DN55163_c0_g1_i1.p1 TRINITY_DN55163_c0_g1~~TRINITY_DN55163_c0_g1_i1.p1  ORF type:complete len:227 (+),score=27.33 TRINITY_DN55163_c0_g1_i1:88-768(+)